MFSFFAFKKSMKSNVHVLKFWYHNAGHLIFTAVPRDQTSHWDLHLTRTISHLLRIFFKYVLTTLQNSSDSFNHLYCSVEVFPCIPGYIVQIVGLAIWKTNRNFKMILSQQLDRPSPYQTWIIHREFDCLQPLFVLRKLSF